MRMLLESMLMAKFGKRLEGFFIRPLPPFTPSKVKGDGPKIPVASKLCKVILFWQSLHHQLGPCGRRSKSPLSPCCCERLIYNLILKSTKILIEDKEIVRFS